MTKTKEVTNNGHVFTNIGEGMSRRSRNINTVKNLILNGLSYQEIWNIAGEFFTSKTFDEYYQFASNRIKIESENSESATEYIKRKEAEKNKK